MALRPPRVEEERRAWVSPEPESRGPEAEGSEGRRVEAAPGGDEQTGRAEQVLRDS